MPPAFSSFLKKKEGKKTPAHLYGGLEQRWDEHWANTSWQLTHQKHHYKLHCIIGLIYPFGALEEVAFALIQASESKGFHDQISLARSGRCRFVHLPCGKFGRFMLLCRGFWEGVGSCTINEGAKWETCLPATGRRQMPHTLVLAEHADHLLRFSFIASTHVERPRAVNDQEKDGSATLQNPSVRLFCWDSAGIRPERCWVELVTY